MIKHAFFISAAYSALAADLAFSCMAADRRIGLGGDGLATEAAEGEDGVGGIGGKWVVSPLLVSALRICSLLLPVRTGGGRSGLMTGLITGGSLDPKPCMIALQHCPAAWGVGDVVGTFSTHTTERVAHTKGLLE